MDYKRRWRRPYLRNNYPTRRRGRNRVRRIGRRRSLIRIYLASIWARIMSNHQREVASCERLIVRGLLSCNYCVMTFGVVFFIWMAFVIFGWRRMGSQFLATVEQMTPGVWNLCKTIKIGSHNCKRGQYFQLSWRVYNSVVWNGVIWSDVWFWSQLSFPTSGFSQAHCRWSKSFLLWRRGAKTLKQRKVVPTSILSICANLATTW